MTGTKTLGANAIFTWTWHFGRRSLTELLDTISERMEGVTEEEVDEALEDDDG